MANAENQQSPLLERLAAESGVAVVVVDENAAEVAAAGLVPCIAVAGEVLIGGREMRTLGVESAYAVRESASDDPTGGDVTEADLVFNVVWTGTVFPFLQYFVASQIAQSEARFRFVANGCPPDPPALPAP